MLLLLLIGIGYYAYTQTYGKKQQTTQYITEQARKGTLVAALTSSGSVTSSNNAEVTTAVSGTVEEVYVKSGDTVQKGTPLLKLTLDQDSQQKQSQTYSTYLSALNNLKQAEINRTTLQSQLETARKAILDAQSAVDQMEARLGASQPNPSTHQSYTQNEIDSIRSSATSARESFAAAEQKYTTVGTSIAASQASLNSAAINYQQVSNIITAPVSGTLSNFTLQKGTNIASTNTSSNASSTNSTATSTTQKIALIKTGSKPSITIKISEIDIPKVHISDNVTMTADAFPDKTFTGRVSDIDTTGSNSSGVVTYPVTVTADTDNDQLYPNMSVTANIITLTKDNVLLVPSSAVKTTNGESTIQILKNNKVQQVTVMVGESSDTQTEIKSGINEGDEIVTSTLQTGTASSSGTTSPFGGGGFGGARIFGGGGNNRPTGGTNTTRNAN